jgi:hypothetical protein
MMRKNKFENKGVKSNFRYLEETVVKILKIKKGIKK